VVRQSEVLAHRKKWLFCKVTPVSIQTFVEGLLRLANVLEATHGTLNNVNNIYTMLMRAEISKPNTTICKSRTSGDKRCKFCRHMQHSSSYPNKVTGKQYNIFCTVNCVNIIYIIECSVCGLQYVRGDKV
jgi:hypothetical protein